MKKILFLITILPAMMSLTACSDDDNPSDSIELYDIVRLESVTEKGSVFTLCKPASDDEITLVAPQIVNTKLVAEGERLLIMYVPDSREAYRSGSVTLKGYGTIINGELKHGDDEDIDGWESDPVYLLSAWRSGKYLNIHARLQYGVKPQNFNLVMPDEQSGGKYPDLYLVYSRDADVTTFSRAYYASYDISELVEDSDVEGFTLHLNNSNLKLDEIKFDK